MKILVIGGCGYIGSRLCPELRNFGHDVSTVDPEMYGNPSNPLNVRMRSAEIADSYLHSFDTVINIASSTSSVFLCEAYPQESVGTNIVDLCALATRLKPEQRFLYASSSSVYDQAEKQVKGYAVVDLYVAEKVVNDMLMERIRPNNTCGLRFGSVNGMSPGFRTDLVINAMTFSAIEKGKITVFNRGNPRPVLGLSDLCHAVNAIIVDEHEPIRYANLCSMMVGIQEIAEEVASEMGVPIVYGEDVLSTGQTMDNSDFCERYNFRFESTIRGIVREIADNYGSIKKHVTVRNSKRVPVLR